MFEKYIYAFKSLFLDSEKRKIKVKNQIYEYEWLDNGPIQNLSIYKFGKHIGTKEFSHLTDKSMNVVQYAVKSLVEKSQDKNY